MINNLDKYYMSIALQYAKKAYEENEVPIGAIVVKDNKIIGVGYNRRNGQNNPLAHAEIYAINHAAKHIGDWRLEDCRMYITLEPCPMCAGAIVQARIPCVVIATQNPKAGCAGSIVNLLQEPQFNHQVSIHNGVLRDQSQSLLKKFFKELRHNKNTGTFKK